MSGLGAYGSDSFLGSTSGFSIGLGFFGSGLGLK